MDEQLQRLMRKGSDFLGVRYPVICGGMTWISNFELVEAVAAAGGFPVFAGGNMSAADFEREVDRCLQNIKTPFAVNLITLAPNFRAQYDVIRGMEVPFVVFAGGIPRKRDIQAMKDSGKKTLSFAPEGSIAAQQIRFGIDALILEGSEAGGHIGHVSLTVLLQQVLFRFDEVPIFVAGGIASGRMMAHLLLMGAAGCQMGTRFVMCRECTAHENMKKAFARAQARQAIATPQYDSRLPVVAVRAIKNKGTDEFGRLQLRLLQDLEAGRLTREQAQFEVESFWVGALRRAVVDGDVEAGSLMAGQSVGLVADVLPVKEIMQEILTDAAAELDCVRRRLGCDLGED